MSRLADRDKVEKADAEYYHAFAQLARLRAVSGDANADRLAKENAQLRDENESLVARLNLQTIKLESTDSRVKELSKAVRIHEGRVARMNGKIAELTEALAEKNRLFDVANDEHLISQIQHNVLLDKVRALEQELAKLKTG